MKSPFGVEGSSLPATSLGASDGNQKNQVNTSTGKAVFTCYPGVFLDSRSTDQERLGATGTTELDDMRPNIGYTEETKHILARKNWQQKRYLEIIFLSDIDTKHECTITKHSDTIGENVSKLLKNPYVIVQISHYLKFYLPRGLSFIVGEMRGLS